MTSLAQQLNIATFPVEVLHSIFASTLRPSSFASETPDSFSFDAYGALASNLDEVSDLNQLLVLRAVCRKFWRVADETRIWITQYFRLINVYKEYPADTPFYVPDGEEESVIATHNIRIQQYKKLKDMWIAFGGTDSLEITSNVEKPPLITIFGVGSESRYQSRNNGITAISRTIEFASIIPVFQDVACLRIQCVLGINLDTLTTLFPNIRTLQIGHFAETTGSLQTLRNLCTLDIDERGTDECHLCAPYFPSHSAHTLNHLKIRYGLGEQYPFPIYKLNPFDVLTHLHLEPLTADICDFLSRTGLKLVYFGTKLGWTNVEVDVAMLSAMFSAPAMHTLHELNFSLRYWDAYVEENYPREWEEQSDIIEAITRNCPTINKLVVQMPFDIAWCAKFAMLKNLRFVEWKVLWSFIYEEVSCQRIVEEFKSAFETAREISVDPFIRVMPATG